MQSAVQQLWQFDHIGGFNQLRISKDEDWQHLADLDHKLWAVLSCPTQQLALESKFLRYVDSDQDGRIRVSELVALVQWACEALKKPSQLTHRQAILGLEDIREDTALGQAVRALLSALCTNEETQTVALSQVQTLLARFAQQPFNGDGIITIDSTANDDLQAAIKLVMQTLGSSEDVSGKMGIDESLLDTFDIAVAERIDWHAQAEAAGAWCLGEDTVKALSLLDQLSAKVEDYYARCALAGFDEQAVTALNPAASVYEAMYATTLVPTAGEIEHLPIAHIGSDALLPLDKGVNPAWSGLLQQFKQLVVLPLLGDREHLSYTDWQTILQKLSVARSFLESQQGAVVAGVALVELQNWQSQSLAEQLRALIQQDLLMANQLAQMETLLKLLYCLRDLDKVVQNFVALRDFYHPDRRAQFEAGTLFMDSRSMRLCLTVQDVASHAGMAHRAGTFLLYCDCTHRSGEKRSIVAAVTAGDSDELMVGRHGVFYDRDGDEWEAVVVRMIENPISVSEAFWSPYKRIGRLISTQLEKFATARDKAVEEKSTATVAEMATKASSAKPAEKAPAAPFDIAKFAGIFAAVGLAVGAVGTAIATVITGFLMLAWWQMPLVIVGVILSISGPAMLLAWLKLRKRNLGPVLDANGWAMNARVSIPIAFGNDLTRLAALPKGAKVNLIDPFAKARQPWLYWLWPVVVITLAVLAYWGYEEYQQKQDAAAVVAPQDGQPVLKNEAGDAKH